MKVIAVDIDDTLNNFSEVLTYGEFLYNSKYGVSQHNFAKWLPLVQRNFTVNNSRKYLDFAADIHREVYVRAEVKPGVVEFMQWLKLAGYTTVIVTYRDLRYCLNETRDWLEHNHIPYDYLFSTDKKIHLCHKLGIPYLIDDYWKNVLRSGWRGIQVFYPIMSSNERIIDNRAIGFTNILEVKKWIS